jgi:hypothetical protein
VLGHLGITLADLLKVLNIRSLPSFNMVKRVITYPMAGRHYPLKHPGVFPDVIANAKKSSLGAKRLKGVENKFRYRRDRPVIEREKDIWLIRAMAPQECRVQPREKEWGAKNIDHITPRGRTTW